MCIRDRLLSSDGTDTVWIDASTTSVANANNVGTNVNSTNADQFVTFVENNSGNNPIRVDAGLKYNPSTNRLTAGSFAGDGANLTNVSSAEVYGFTGIGSNLQVRTTNKGADDITSAQYDAFEQVLFAPSGITFSINNNGNLIATF